MAHKKHHLTKHGLSRSKIYSTWCNMRNRCMNPNVPCYGRYGGRGIRVCDRWQSFENFYKDMGSDFKNGLQIDRIDNNGDYEPSNCQWVTLKANTRNTRRTRYITYAGVTRCATEWAEELGIKRSTFNQRLYVYKWPVDRLIGDYLGPS